MLHSIAVLFLLAAVFSFHGCKTNDTGEFTLTVTMTSGTSGTPEVGTYHYNQGDQVYYSYSANESFTNLKVTIDAEEVEDTGTLTITKDHTINVASDPQYLIMGSWTLKEEYEDDRFFEVTITFTGDELTGTSADTQGGNGTYEVDSTKVTFTLEFPNARYEYTGYFTNVDAMSGEATRTSYTTGTELTGTWEAAKN